MYFFILTLGLFLILVFGSYFYLRKVVLLKRPTNAPTQEFIANMKPSDECIVFAGDSNTHGNMGYNWTNDVLTSFTKINAGVNGDLSHNLLNRLEEITACKPKYLCILIGTNDVNAALSPKSRRRYEANGKVKAGQIVDIESFEKNLHEIVGGVQNANLCILSLPLMGENLNSEVNKLADDYSQIIKNVAEVHQISFIDIRNEMKDYIRMNQKVKPPAFEKYYFTMVKSIYLHFYFGFSFNRLSQMNHMLLSHDQLHQNSISGEIISRKVSTWLGKVA